MDAQPQHESERAAASLSQRPLTLPQDRFRLDLNADLLSGYADLFAGIGIGIGYGAWEDLQLDAFVLPVIVAEDPGFGDMQASLTYRFLSGPVEGGIRAEFVIPSGQPQTSSVEGAVAVAFPVRVHLGSWGRLDTGVETSFVFFHSEHLFRDGVIATLGTPRVLTYPGKRHPIAERSTAGVPVILTVNPTELVFFGVRTGFGIETLERAGESFFVPLGLQGGLTIEGQGHLLTDLILRFRWPTLFRRLEDDPGVAQVWEIVLASEVYFGGADPNPASGVD